MKELKLFKGSHWIGTYWTGYYDSLPKKWIKYCEHGNISDETIFEKEYYI